jgi:hypothetical protein
MQRTAWQAADWRPAGIQTQHNMSALHMTGSCSEGDMLTAGKANLQHVMHISCWQLETSMAVRK